MSKWENVDEIKEKIRGCYTYSDVLRSINIPARGDNFITLKNFINKNKIDISHFAVNNIENYQKIRVSNKERKLEDIFKINSDAKSKQIRGKILKYKLLPYKCAGLKCSIQDIWLDESLTLVVDHINGIWHDNRIENLRFLCPNCHSQTITYVGKNSSKEKRLEFQKTNTEFIGRGKLNFLQLIKEDNIKDKEAINFLEQEKFLIKDFEVIKEEIQKELLDYSVRELALKYKCSDSGLRKALLKRGLFLPSSKDEGYWQKVKNNKIVKAKFEDLVYKEGIYSLENLMGS